MKIYIVTVDGKKIDKVKATSLFNARTEFQRLYPQYRINKNINFFKKGKVMK